MGKECNSLKEALDITFDKYGYKKTEGFYENFLKTIMQGRYDYITSDFGARKYVMENNNDFTKLLNNNCYEFFKKLILNNKYINNSSVLKKIVDTFDKIEQEIKNKILL